jgi:hypothetical protein
MPEFSHVSAPALKTALGTLTTTDPSQIAKIIKTQFPNVAISQDDKGNFLFKSGEDGKLYALKPGASIDDIAKGAGMVLAFTPAGRAEGVVSGALASGATQTAIEGTKAAAGGDFNANDVLAATAIGGAIPGVGKLYQAGKSALGAGERAAAGEAAPVASAVAEEAPGEAPKPPVDDFTDKIIGVESGGNAAAQNPNSTASGTGQFLNSTWLETVKKYAPEIAQGKTDSQIIALKSNPILARQMVKDYASENAGILKAEGQPITPGNIYLAHFAGPQGAIDLLNADAGATAKSVLGQKVIAANPFLKDMSAADVVAWADKKMGGAVAASEVKAAVGNTATPELMPAKDLAQTARAAATDGLNSTNAKAVLAEQAAPDAKTLEAAKRLGIEDNLQPDHISTNQAYRELSQVIKSVPGSALHAQETEGLANVAKRADSLVSELGGTQDLSTLSNSVKSGLSDAQQALDKQADRLYAKLRQSIPAAAPVEANNTLAFIDRRAEELGGVQNLTPIERTLFRKLSPQEVKGEVAAPAIQDGQVITPAEYKALMAARQGATETKAPTYALLDDQRKAVGSGLKNAGPFKDEDIGLKKQLYKALTLDQAKVAEAHGMQDTFNLAKATVAQRKGVEDDLTALFGKRLDGTIVNSLKNGVEVLSKGDATTLTKLLSHVPENMRQNVVASGLTAAFQKGSRSGTFNFNGYARWYEGLLKNKQAYHAIMSNLPPAARKQLSDLYRVSNGISMATKEFLRTGKLSEGVAVIKEGMQQADTLMSRLYEAAGQLGKHAGKAMLADMVGGHGFGMATAAISAIKGSSKTDALKAVDALLASPEFEAAAKQIATGRTKQGVSLLAYSKPFLRFSRVLGSPREMTNKERWLMQALETDNNMNSKN